MDTKPGIFIEIDPKKDPRTEGKRHLKYLVKDLPEESSFRTINIAEKRISWMTYYAIQSFKKVENPSEQMVRDVIKGSFIRIGKTI